MMNNEKRFFLSKGYFIGLLVSFIICSVIFALVLITEIYSLGKSFPEDTYHILADSFSVSGVMMLLFFGLVVVTGHGAFDAVTYATLVAVYTVFYKNLRQSKLASSYSEYKELKRGKEKTSVCFLWHVGLIFLVIGLIMLIIFNINI